MLGNAHGRPPMQGWSRQGLTHYCFHFFKKTKKKPATSTGLIKTKPFICQTHITVIKPSFLMQPSSLHESRRNNPRCHQWRETIRGSRWPTFRSGESPHQEAELDLQKHREFPPPMGGSVLTSRATILLMISTRAVFSRVPIARQ